MCESDKLHDEINVIDIKIYPNRFLKPKTTELLLNKICGLEGYVRFLIHGPSLPKKVFYGPGKGHDVNHGDRKSILVNVNDIDLKVMVGEIIITVELDKFNDFMNQLEDILTETLSVEYSLLVGIFTRTTSTISDYLKYGIGFENLIDKRYIGLIDSRARSSESISIIK